MNIIKKIFFLLTILSLFLTEITKAYTEKKADIISRRSSKKETLAEAWKKVEN